MLAPGFPATTQTHTHTQVGFSYLCQLFGDPRLDSYHPPQKELKFLLPPLILRLLQLLLDHLQTNSCSSQMFCRSTSTFWKRPLFLHLLLFVFDVVDEFVGFLKNLPFVFAREVVKPRITKHLESRR